MEPGLEQVPRKECVSVCRLVWAICAVEEGVQRTHLPFPSGLAGRRASGAPSLDLQGLRQAISPEPQFSALGNGKNTSGTDFRGWDRP